MTSARVAVKRMTAGGFANRYVFTPLSTYRDKQTVSLPGIRPRNLGGGKVCLSGFGVEVASSSRPTFAQPRAIFHRNERIPPTTLQEGIPRQVVIDTRDKYVCSRNTQHDDPPCQSRQLRLFSHAPLLAPDRSVFLTSTKRHYTELTPHEAGVKRGPGEARRRRIVL